MKLKNILSLLVIIYSISCFSQLSGYMGKRFTIGYSNYFFPALVGANATSKEISMNTTHCINVEYVIHNKINFCVGMQFFKTGVLKKSYEYKYLNNQNYYSYEATGSAIYKGNKKPMELNTTNIMLGFKFFKSGFIAPVGKYQKLDVIVLLDKLIYSKDAFVDESRDKGSKNVTLGIGTYDYTTLSIGYTVGRQRVLFNSIILDTGVRFGISPNGIFDSTFGNLGGDYNKSFEEELKQTVNYRIMGAQLFNVHIGIGFLPF